MIRRPLAAVLLALAVLGLAACGADPETAASGAPRGEDDKVRQAQVKFAQCMRENGIDMPDPAADGKQRFKVGGDSGISPEAFERANEACEKYREGIRPNLSEEEQQELKERALENARCMREHGIDFPDPVFEADGGVSIRLERGRVDPDDPDFQAAQKECGGGMMMQGREK